MKQPSIPTIIGWIGTAFAIGSYGFFAAGMISEFWLFAIGNIASVLLVWALIHNKTYYAAALQSMFFILNTIGIVRIFFGH